jgi:hypothetical protein
MESITLKFAFYCYTWSRYGGRKSRRLLDHRIFLCHTKQTREDRLLRVEAIMRLWEDH